MDNAKIIKNIIELAKEGIAVDLKTLPANISKDVISRSLLFIELQKLTKNNGSADRIKEIKNILKKGEEVAK